MQTPIITTNYQRNGSEIMLVTEKAREYISSARKKLSTAGESARKYQGGRETSRKTEESKDTQSFWKSAINCTMVFAAGIILGSAELPFSVYPLGTAFALTVRGDKYAFFAFIGAATACIGYGDGAAAFFAVNTLCFFSRAFISYFRFDESVKKKLAIAVGIASLCCGIICTVSGFEKSYVLYGVSYAAGLVAAAFCFCEVIPAAKKKRTSEERCEKKGHRFEQLSGAFTSLSEVVYNISDKLKYPSKQEVREMVSEAVASECFSCPSYESCTGKMTDSEGEVLDIIGDRLMSGGLCKKDLPEKYAADCTKLSEVVQKLNDGYAELVNDRFRENKTEILASEYSTMARLIKYTSQKEKTDKTPDKQLYEIANAALAAIGVRFTSLEAYGQRMKTIDVHGVKLDKFPCTSEELARYMSEKCGYLFGEPEYIGIGEKTTLRLTRKRKIRLEYARHAKAKGENTVNGDSASFFESDDHYFYALISDGMGSGRSAALTSRLTSVFIEKLLTTGAHKTVTLEMLNNLLLSKNDESFATVDLLEIDLLSGEASFIKAGAAPAYILRASKLYKIASFTPPAGIIRSFNAENTKFTLEKGDTVMMLSDGIVQSYDEVPWLCELLSADKGEDPARLAERVLNKARRINLREDDMTCVAVRVI